MIEIRSEFSHGLLIVSNKGGNAVSDIYVVVPAVPVISIAYGSG